jgi:hypothetical protein
MQNLENRPVPAAIDGRKWTVSDSPGGGGGTDTRKADMFAPLSDSPTARMIRNHELIHARITPAVSAGEAAKKHEVSAEALQWAEDYRVGRLQTRMGLVDAEAFTEAEAAVFVKGIVHSPRLVAGALMATLSTTDQYCRLFDAIQAAAPAAGIDDRDIDDMATAIEEIVDMAYPHRRRRRGRMPKDQRFTKRGFTAHTVPLARMFDERFPVAPPPGHERRDEETRRATKQVQRVKGAGRWGVIERIVKLPHSRTVRPRRPISRRFSDMGVIPSAVHRLPVDGAIFSVKRRARGGTILCDASGSMAYDDADIERIITEAPAATIAFYSGFHSSTGYAGRIVIAASAGKAATVGEVYKALKGGNNFIDGPALRWLAKQPGPRWWVSDEEVGGAGGDFGIGGPCWQECRMICSAGSIQSVRSIDMVR